MGDDRMRIRAQVATAIIGGVWALGCRTPSSVSTPATAPMTAGTLTDNAMAARMTWTAPGPGRTFTLLPTPKTVAWGWYDAAGVPILRVGSGDEVIVRALST